jgi:hypothetical protein
MRQVVDRGVSLGVAVALSAAACGGSTAERTSSGTGGGAGSDGVGGSGAAGAGGTGASAGSGGSSAVELRLTSYDLKFEGVTLAHSTSGESPSEGASVRVDLGRFGSDYRATATPRWGYPSEATVVFEEPESGAKGVRLSTGLHISGTNYIDDWHEITVSLDASGELRGPVTAAGTRRLAGGDFGYSVSLHASGTIELDQTAPQVDAVLESPHGPPGALLPWDELVVRAAEGVDAADLDSRIRVESAEPPVPVIVRKRSPTADDPTAWSGSVRVNGRLQSWPDVNVDFALNIDAGAPDLVGLRTAGYTTKSTVMSFGSAVGRNDFDDNGPAVALWGRAARLGGSTGADPRCENNGCLMIGPLANAYCAERSGIAGRITTTSPLVSMRYRVLVGPTHPASTELPPFSPPLQFDLVAPGGEVTSTTLYIESSWMELLPEPQGALRWGTPWRTLETPIPAGDVGYSVYSGTLPCIFPPGGGGDVSKMPIAILLDWIAG